MTEREYDVLLVVELSKVVRIKARSMKEAKRLATSTEDYEGEGMFGTEHIGDERVFDVVRAGDPWHHDRKSSGTAGKPS